jgi:hypothetical protein
MLRGCVSAANDRNSAFRIGNTRFGMLIPQIWIGSTVTQRASTAHFSGVLVQLTGGPEVLVLSLGMLVVCILALAFFEGLVAANRSHVKLQDQLHTPLDVR